MAIQNNFPNLTPTLLLDFANAGKLDPRVTFSRATTATYFNSLGVLTTANNNVARFDYDPSTLAAQGLLIEEQRTNLCLQSENFATTWTVSGASISTNTIISPAATLTGDSLVEDTSAGSGHRVAQIVTADPTVTYTATCYVKAAGRTWARLLIDDNSGNGCSGWFNLSTGVVGSTANAGTGSGAAISITAAGNGWYRCVLTGKPATFNNSNVRFLISGATGDLVSTYTGDGTTSVYLWGAQLEAGAFATSYIPTTTTALTRNADVASMTGTNFSGWFNATEGTLFSESINLPGQSAVVFPRIANINDGTTNNVITTVWRSDTSRLYGAVTVSGVNVAEVGVVGVTQTNANKIALGYATDNFASSVNGGAVNTDTSGAIPSVNRLGIGRQASAADFINGYIRRIAYYPVRVTDAQLQALTG
jgi:hypothetical protein